MYKISVIIPVYNCEKFLQKCLDSVVMQTYQNLEIICVDDGSTDKSAQILKEYSLKDSRFKIISQKNEGQSSARNRGLEEATGEYISFIDADDWVSLCLYEKFIKKLVETQKKNLVLDIYMFNVLIHETRPKDVNPKSFLNIKNWLNYQHQDHIHTFDDCLSPFGGNMAVYNKIYRADFLRENKIEFINGLIFEDQVFYLQSFLKAKSIAINNDPLYIYRVNNSSSTTNNLNKKVFQIFKIINKLENILKENKRIEEYKYAFLQHKYNQYSFLYFKTPLFSKPKFYDQMKARLLLTQQENFKPSVCEKLAGYNIFEDILKLNWWEFYFKYRKKLKK
ncbi:MAG: glycosyltransferase [Clostridium sp.]|nr:glycosyltransferase [Clostridium sp.]